jgi:hypothetical protein
MGDSGVERGVLDQRSDVSGDFQRAAAASIEGKLMLLGHAPA